MKRGIVKKSLIVHDPLSEALSEEASVESLCSTLPFRALDGGII